MIYAIGGGSDFNHPYATVEAYDPKTNQWSRRRDLPKPLNYLATYVYRTAFSAERILSDDGQYIRFSYRDSQQRKAATARLTVQAFLHCFLQHVLPPGVSSRALLWLA